MLLVTAPILTLGEQSEAGFVIVDLKSCQEKVVLRRKTVKDTRERWFGAETVASSAAGEAALRTTIRVSDVVEVVGAQYIDQQQKLGLLCCGRSVSSPGKKVKRCESSEACCGNETTFC